MDEFRSQMFFGILALTQREDRHNLARVSVWFLRAAKTMWDSFLGM